LLIVRDAFFGVRRFDDFVHDLGISRGSQVTARVGSVSRLGERPPGLSSGMSYSA